MKRKTITIPDALFREINSVRADFIRADHPNGERWPTQFSTVAVMLLAMAVEATKGFTLDDWRVFRDEAKRFSERG